MHIYSNAGSPILNYVDSSQLTNWILDSGVTCRMTLDISDFILGLLMETDKYIKVVDEHFFTEKQTGKVQMKTRDNNGKPFIDTLYNVLLAPDLCDQLFSIIILMNSRHN